MVFFVVVHKDSPHYILPLLSLPTNLKFALYSSPYLRIQIQNSTVASTHIALLVSALIERVDLHAEFQCTSSIRSDPIRFL